MNIVAEVNKKHWGEPNVYRREVGNNHFVYYRETHKERVLGTQSKMYSDDACEAFYLERYHRSGWDDLR